MNYAYSEISFQEIPDEISVVVGFTGCSLHCSGCHSKELWDENYGKLMTPEKMENILYKYKGKCSCFVLWVENGPLMNLFHILRWHDLWGIRRLYTPVLIG